MKLMTPVAVSIVALIPASCGGGSSKSTSSHRRCRASIGIEAPTTGPLAELGREQLAFAKLAVANDNRDNGTHISLVQGNSQLIPALAVTVAEQMIAKSQIVAVVGPAGNQEVEAVGPLFGRAGMAFISGSATKSSLTDGANPTFFRVVASDARQGLQVADFVISKLHPKALVIIDDQGVYSTGLAKSLIPRFREAGVTVYHESVSQKTSSFSPLVAKITPQTTVVVLPWQAPGGAQQFGRTLTQQHKPATIVATDRVYSPGSFTTPGAYVSAFAPDVTAIPGDASLVRQAQAALPKFGIFGPPVYAATHVVDKAIAAVCKAGQTPTRSDVLPAVKATDQATSILGRPIRFDSHGDLTGAKWFVFHINSAGQYKMIRDA